MIKYKIPAIKVIANLIEGCWIRGTVWSDIDHDCYPNLALHCWSESASRTRQCI